MNIIQVDKLTKSFGANLLFEDISFTINKAEKVALIAKNGTGKTTLLKIMTGKESPDSGKIVLNKDARLGFLPQEPNFDGNKTVIEQVFSSSDSLITAVKEYNRAMESQDEKAMHNAIAEMDRLQAWDYESKITQILDKLKITDLNQKVAQLSGGQQKRLALANTLINEPDFLIMDEPTNHLDYEMIEWLEEYLSKSHITLLLVTHDRYFLDKVCNRIIEIDDNTVYNYKGTYAQYLQKRAERIELQASDIEKAKNLLRKEADWMNRMPQARGTKAKYRIDAFYKTKEAASKQIDNSKVEMDIDTARLGTKIIDIYNISKSFGDKLLIKDFSYKFVRFEKIGIAGNNGIGKSTLLRILAGELPPDSGEIDTGSTVVFGYYKQEGLKIDDNMRVIDVITDVADHIKLGKNRTLSAAQFLELFLFPRNTHYADVSKLSGGQKRKLYLMTILMKNPNFLILDEPTNDFDIATLNVLEDFLQDYKGNVLVVSHDRYFTDKVADTLFVFEGEGIIKHFPGNYSAYRATKLKEAEEKNKVKSVKISKKEKPKSAKSNKMSFKEKFEFEALEKEIEDLSEEKKQIETELNSGDLEHDEIAQKAKRHQELITLLDEKEFRWLELSEKEQ